MTPKEREKLRYDQKKRSIANKFGDGWRYLSLDEGISAGFLVYIEAAIAVILALLLLPEPLISKAIAALIAAGAGVIGAGVAVYILISSFSDFNKLVSERNAAENDEDKRHSAALERLGQG